MNCSEVTFISHAAFKNLSKTQILRHCTASEVQNTFFVKELGKSFPISVLHLNGDLKYNLIKFPLWKVQYLGVYFGSRSCLQPRLVQVTFIDVNLNFIENIRRDAKN